MLEYINRLQCISPNFSGFLAILLWSTGAMTVSFLKSIPPFQFLSTVFLLIFAAALLKLAINQSWLQLKLSWGNWLLIMSGIPLQQVLYVYSYQTCAPEEIDIIIYLWPLIAMGLLAGFGNKKLLLRHVIAGGLGFLSVLVLSTKGTNPNSYFEIGHLTAVLCALAWSFYTVFSTRFPRLTFEALGVSCGLGFVATLCSHIGLETFYNPSVLEWAGIGYYTFFIATLPFILWSYAIQRGNSILLTTSSYFKPLLSILLLILSGFTLFSSPIITAGCLVVLAGLLSNDFFASLLSDKIGPMYLYKQNLNPTS